MSTDNTLSQLHPDIDGRVAPAATPARKPRIWTTFVTWLVALFVGQLAVIAAFVTVGLGIGIVMGAQGADGAAIQARVQQVIQQPVLALMLSLLPFQLGMAAVVLLAARRSKEPLKERLGLLPQSGRTFGTLRLTALAAFTTSTAFATVIGSSMLLGELPANPISSAINDSSWLTLTLISVVLSLLPVLVEEIMFRGYIQRRLLQRWSPAMAIGVSTLLFALMHSDSLKHMVAVIPLGIVTGLLAYRTNSVKPGMLVHAIHNAGAVGIGAMGRILTPVIGDEGVGMVIIGMVVLLALIGLPAIVALMRRSPTQVSLPQKMLFPAVEPHASQAA
jgi:membrane protease YdiL (CAAX protease family)